MSVASASLQPNSRLRELPGCLAKHRDFVNVVEALRPGVPATLDGIWGSSCALTVAELLRVHCIAHPSPLVVVLPTPPLPEVITIISATGWFLISLISDCYYFIRVSL